MLMATYVWPFINIMNERVKSSQSSCSSWLHCSDFVLLNKKLLVFVFRKNHYDQGETEVFKYMYCNMGG